MNQFRGREITRSSSANSSRKVGISKDGASSDSLDIIIDAKHG
jgi:hypothetical protein